MKVAIFSESFEPSLNGVAVSTGTLVRELRASGHEVCVFAPAHKGHADPGNHVYRFPSFTTWVEPEYPIPIPYMRRLAHLVKDLGVDIIHTQTPWMLGWLGLRLARRLDIPLISTNHTQYPEYAHYFPLAPRSVTRSFIVGLMRRYYNQCDGIIVPSSPIGQMLRDYGVHKPIFTIPTGVSIQVRTDPEARRRVREELGIGSGDRVLLYVGRLAREKNLELLLESFERLSPGNPDLWLLIVGGGPYEAECRRKTEALNARTRVLFTGAVPRERVMDYYSAGDIFVFPSSTDTQGLVLCEALLAGLPCVAVNAGGSPEMVVHGEDGFLTENNPEDFTAKIDQLLSDDATLRRFSLKASENASRFSTSAMANRVLMAYESVRGCISPL